MNRLLLLSCCLLCPPAFAQDPVIWNGGITLEERATAPTEGTKLVFFVKGGNFLSDVRVEIRDASRKVVVDTVTKGPWLILDLPQGRYSVRATTKGGEAQGGYIDVTGGRQEFGYMFPLTDG